VSLGKYTSTTKFISCPATGGELATNTQFSNQMAVHRTNSINCGRFSRVVFQRPRGSAYVWRVLSMQVLAVGHNTRSSSGLSIITQTTRRRLQWSEAISSPGQISEQQSLRQPLRQHASAPTK